MRRVIIDGQPGEIRAAVLSNETLVDLLIERTTCPNPVGARYLGRVTAFNGEMQSAFVDIGLDRPALLPRKSAMTRLNEGDRAVVEVVRAPSLGKGAKLKQDIPNIDETDGRVPRLLTPAKPLLDFLTRYAPADIRVSGQVALAELRAQAPNFAATATVERADAQPFADLGLEEAIEGLSDPEVRLETGGRLFIEPVRTLTAIDVDTGAQAVYAGASGLTPEAANRAAIPEIVRQIRLRGLSGLIVIDFLEVATKQARNEISAELQSAFADDPTPTDVGPMRASGLMEVTRQRTRWPLHTVLMERCGHAESGLQPRADTVAREILRGIAREARAHPGKVLSVRAAPEVVDAFEDSVADARGELEQRLGQSLTLRADRTLAREAWEIEEGAAV
jgi:Ribonuclease G/E